MNEIGEVGPRDAAAQRLMAVLAAAVRSAREAAGLSRRLLSERSGVSQRYLAQLEAGHGNISIALLARVAEALDVEVTALLGAGLAAGEAGDPEALRMAALWAVASPEVRAEVAALLDPAGPEPRRAGRIALIGLRGAGKSTLGAALGADLGLPFVELNREIEAAAGMPVAEVMALYGIEGYRRLEGAALRRVAAAHDRLVLAVAGGIVGEAATYGFLLEAFHAVWLRARPEEHMARVRAQGDERPMAGNPRAMEALRSLLTAREAEYARASAVLDTSGVSLEASRGALLELVRGRGFAG